MKNFLFITFLLLIYSLSVNAEVKITYWKSSDGTNWRTTETLDKDGKRHGKYEDFDMDLNQPFQYGNYVHGKKEGKYYWNMSNGTTNIYDNKNGKRIKLTVIDRNTKNLISACDMNDFIKEGECIEYFSNGKIMKKSLYAEDKKHGLEFIYDINENLIQKSLYINGKQVSVINNPSFLDNFF